MVKKLLERYPEVKYSPDNEEHQLVSDDFTLYLCPLVGGQRSPAF